MATKRSPEGNVLFSQAFETDEGVSIVLSDIWRKDSAERIAPFKLKDGEKLQFRIFMDRSILEVFANARQCVTQRTYPSRNDSLGVILFSEGGFVEVESLQAWQMAATNHW